METTRMASDLPAASGNVIQLRAEETGTEPELAAAQPPGYLDLTPADAVRRRPVIPVALHRANVRGTLTQQAGLRWHQARYHGLRFPFYLLAYGWHAVRGAGRLAASVLNWWHW